MTVESEITSDHRHLLAPYLPRLVIDWVEESPDQRHRIVEGTVAFVDISGFTKLSEGLAKHGKIGAEELAATIGDCFVALLAIHLITPRYASARLAEPAAPTAFERPAT